MQSELKPTVCPFCGVQGDLISDGTLYWVGCGGCLAEGPLTDSENDAIAAWNRSAPEGEEK